MRLINKHPIWSQFFKREKNPETTFQSFLTQYPINLDEDIIIGQSSNDLQKLFITSRHQFSLGSLILGQVGSGRLRAQIGLLYRHIASGAGGLFLMKNMM